MMGAKVLQEDTYVDDIINSKESEQDCMKDAVQIEKILARGSMGLHSLSQIRQVRQCRLTA